MRHAAWDFGVLAETRTFFRQKTVKTMCDKRVPVSMTTTEHVDCEGCRAKVREFLNGARESAERVGRTESEKADLLRPFERLLGEGAAGGAS